MNNLSSVVDRSHLFLNRIRSTFWAIPTLLLIVATCTALLNLWLDISVLPNHEFAGSQWLDPTKTGNIRSLLSTTAAAILGVAGVSFSITIASLTLASQQFGPRLIRTFMQDRFIQVVLGVFVATFFYCMLSMQLDSVAVESASVPLSSLITVLCLTLINLLLLVLFIHHVCVSIQVDTVIAEVSTDMLSRVDTLFPDAIEQEDRVDQEQVAQMKHRIAHEGREIATDQDGYIRFIDYEALTHMALRENLVVDVRKRAGDYVMHGSILFKVIGHREADTYNNALNSQVVISSTRTSVQDMEFTIRQLVEIALRALSPGINDPFTAMTCVDRLGSMLNQIAHRSMPSSVHCDENDDVRLFVNTTSYQGLVEASFNQIRQCSGDKVDVTIRVLDTLTELVSLVPEQGQVDALMLQADMIIAGIENRTLLPIDHKDIVERHAKLADKYSERFGS